MHEFHYIMAVTSVDVHWEIHLNGFPLDRGEQGGRGQWMDMINLHLTGSERLSIKATNAEDPESGFQVSLRPRVFPEGSWVKPRGGRALEAQVAVNANPVSPDEFGNFMLSSTTGVMEATATFPTQGFDFSSLYRDGEPVPESEALALARQVLNAFDRGDTATLVDLSAGRINDLAIAYGRPEEAIRASLTEEIEAMIAAGPLPHPEPPPLQAATVVDGALRELTLTGGPLLLAGPAEERIRAPAFAGVRNGRVQILR
jgi:hypothetical protein